MAGVQITYRAIGDPRLSRLSLRQRWELLRLAAYMAEWGLDELKPALVRGLGLSRWARQLVAANVCAWNENGALILTCTDLLRVQAATPPRPRSGCTYLIQAGDGGAVKIGSTRASAEERLTALQTGSAEPLRLVAVLEGAHLERTLHERFAAWRLHGEWFDPAVLQMVEI